MDKFNIMFGKISELLPTIYALTEQETDKVKTLKEIQVVLMDIAINYYALCECYEDSLKSSREYVQMCDEVRRLTLDIVEYKNIVKDILDVKTYADYKKAKEFYKKFLTDLDG